MGASPDNQLLNAIRKLDMNQLEDPSTLSEREKMILTTTGSIFKKMVEQKEDLKDYDVSKFQSFNEDYLKSLIQHQQL